MKLLNITFLISLVLFLSCEKEVEVDIPSFDQKLVANCWFTGDGNWYLKVTKTKYILDDGPIEIVDNAVVEIYEEDSLVEILPYISEGRYGLSNGYVAKVGRTYLLTIRSDVYPELSASEILLEKPAILDIDIDLENRIVYNNLVGYFANIFFDDNHVNESFYHIIIYRDFISPNAIEINGVNYSPGDTVFNDYVHYHVDELIDNQICHIGSWYIEDGYFANSNNQLQLLIDQNSVENTIRFNFEIYRITENYFNYGKTVGSYLTGGLIELNGVAYGYSEPSQIESNINNGYGIFASYNGQLTKIDID